MDLQVNEELLFRNGTLYRVIYLKEAQLQIIEYPHIYNFVYFTYTYKFTLSIQQLDIHSLYTCCISGSKYTSSLNICRLYS